MNGRRSWLGRLLGRIGDNRAAIKVVDQKIDEYRKETHQLVVEVRAIEADLRRDVPAYLAALGASAPEPGTP